MSARFGVALTTVVLALLAVGCKETPLVPIGDGGVRDAGDAGSDAGDAGDGGLDAGPYDAGPYMDAGTCRILDGGRVQAGAWLQPESCVLCDPALNPDGWTGLDAGAACVFFLTAKPLGPRDVPFWGVCTSDFVGEELYCSAVFGRCDKGCVDGLCASSTSPQDFPCIGGYCDVESDSCVRNENRGWNTACLAESDCAQGPCCLDAGIVGGGEPDGGGWCCGLIDGGVQICLDAGTVCYDSSNCCAGLTCVGDDAVYVTDVEYGFCR